MVTTILGQRRQEAIGRTDSAAPAMQDWQLRKIAVRSPVEATAWPVARVELHHPARGRVTDIASAPGAFDAAFKAAAQIVGVSPHLISLDVASAVPATKGALSIQLDIRLEIHGAGSSFGVDLLRCAVFAWLEAASCTRPAEQVWKPHASRPFQIRGIDKNDDLWIFASGHEDAAAAIAAEFREEGYSAISFLTNGKATVRPSDPIAP